MEQEKEQNKEKHTEIKIDKEIEKIETGMKRERMIGRAGVRYRRGDG